MKLPVARKFQINDLWHVACTLYIVHIVFQYEANMRLIRAFSSKLKQLNAPPLLLSRFE